MESLIAMGAVFTVVGAISTIIFRVTMGDGQQRRLKKIKRELQQELGTTEKLERKLA